MKNYHVFLITGVLLVAAILLFSQAPARSSLDVEIYVDDGYAPVPGANVYLCPYTGCGDAFIDREIIEFNIASGTTDALGRLVRHYPSINVIGDYIWGTNVILLVVKNGYFNFRRESIAYVWPGESLTYAGWQATLRPLTRMGVRRNSIGQSMSLVPQVRK